MAPRVLRWARGFAGGAVGGLAGFLLGFVLFFVLARGILLNPDIQSAKLIAVWQEMEPIPLAIVNPALFSAGIALIGGVHGLVFAGIVRGLPKDVLKRGLAYGAILWAVAALFFEYFTPFNLFGEPLALVAFQLALWVPVYLVEGALISAIYGKGD